MVVDIEQRLTQLIASRWSSIHKPDAYAKLIIRAGQLGAVDKMTAKRSSELKSEVISDAIFREAYKNEKHCFLNVIESGEIIKRIISGRIGMIFNDNLIIKILNQEITTLIEYIKNYPQDQKHVSMVLKLTDNSIVAIQKELESGTTFQRVTKFSRVFDKLKCYKNNCQYSGKSRRSEHIHDLRSGDLLDCKKIGIYPQPIPRYYLSNRANELLDESERGVSRC